MATRYLRAEELARYAAVAKSTVLAAIRRGDIRSSRTLGRGTRISLESAREYLIQRGCEVPNELREASTSSVAVLTERKDVFDRVRAACEPAWTVAVEATSYATLVWIGCHAPGTVVVDLDMELLNPFEVIRCLRSRTEAALQRIIAAGSQGHAMAAALALGVTDAVEIHDVEALRSALHREARVSMITSLEP